MAITPKPLIVTSLEIVEEREYDPSLPEELEPAPEQAHQQEELKEVGKCQAHDHDPHDHPPSRVRVSM